MPVQLSYSSFKLHCYPSSIHVQMENDNNNQAQADNWMQGNYSMRGLHLSKMKINIDPRTSERL